MNQISKAVSASGAKTYYKEEYEHPRGSYYTEKDTVKGRWSGALAEEMKLSGEIERKDFDRLCDGQEAHTGEQLVKHRPSHQTTNKYGDVKWTSEHRAGWDNTFSAPKSVSIAAIVGGDERIVKAHDAAVDAALKVIERHTQARLGGNKPAETTGKAVFALFRHDAARPDRKDGLAAPDLHTHAFMFNMTKTEAGQVKPLQPLETYRTVKASTAAYRAKLAEGLQKIGYETQVDKRTGAPEIAGISREYIERMSPRQKEIKEAAEADREGGKVKGIVREDGTTSTRTAARQNRRSKVFNRDAMRAEHQRIDREEFGGQVHAVVREAYAQTHEMSALLLWDERGSKARAKEAVSYAIEKASEREAVSDPRALMIDALTRHLGATTLEDVTAEMQKRHEQGELIGILQTDAARRQVTTEKALKMESANVEMMRDGQNTEQPIAKSLPARLTTSQGVTLDESQHKLVEQVCTNRDRIQGVQGIAGGGKTTVVSVIKAKAEEAGYKVEGFAPTTGATQKLGESGIESKTLAKFIRGRQDPDAGKRLLILDESSLASTRQLNAFLQKAQPQDRILLVGDTRQHEGVEAGSPFAQLQAHGMATAKLEKIVRQKDEPLRRVVEKLAIGDVKAAVDDLQQQGRITEVPDAETRLKAIAQDYAEKPEGTLVISPANKEREELNRLIHDERRASGHIGEAEHTTKILKNRTDLTGAERTFAGAYNSGDIIRYSNKSKNFGVEAGEYARVEAVNRKGNMLTVAFAGDDKNGTSERRMTYDPKRLSGVSVYREAEIKASEGERIQVRAPMPKHRIANGELGTLEKIDAGKWTVILDGGRRVSFPVSQNPHVDYGYAVTSHSSQGQTVERVIVNMDTRESDKLLNQRMGYVAASRMRSDVRIYTDSTRELSAALSRQVSKSTALEATQRLPQATLQKGTIHDEQRSTTAPTRANQTAESHEAARAERPFNGFDRSRIRRPAERAERDAGRDARDSESLDRGSLERGTRAATSESGERQSGAGRAKQEVSARPLANERTGDAERTETARVHTGRGRRVQSFSERSSENQTGTEPPRVATGARAEERHPTLETEARRFTAERSANPNHAAEQITSGFRNEDAGRHSNRVPDAESQLHGLRTGEPSTDTRSDVPTAAPDERDDLRAERIRHDRERVEGRAMVLRNTGSGLDSLRGSTRDVVPLLDERRSHRDVGSDGIDSGRVASTNRVQVPHDNGTDVGIVHDGRDDIGLRRISEESRAGEPLQRLGTLDKSTAPSIADSVREITGRPDEYERMAGDLVRLANENRIAATEQEISQPVQDFMHDNLLKSAERPPSEQQMERDRQIAQAAGHTEPHHENALQSSLYAAQNAPNRSDLLNNFTAQTEAAFTKQQQTITREPEPSIGFSSWQQSRDDHSIDR
jgi:conjugative relaxase-like TrwC/TraI family protein